MECKPMSDEISALRHDLERSMDATLVYLNEFYRLEAALRAIAAEAYVTAENWPQGWRDVAVERIDIARAALAQGMPAYPEGDAPLIELSAEAWDSLCNALDSPPPPTGALIRLMRDAPTPCLDSSK
jgi:hypothetical protein